jgi:hypothetical protein
MVLSSRAEQRCKRWPVVTAADLISSALFACRARAFPGAVAEARKVRHAGGWGARARTHVHAGISKVGKVSGIKIAKVVGVLDIIQALMQPCTCL